MIPCGSVTERSPKGYSCEGLRLPNAAQRPLEASCLWLLYIASTFILINIFLWVSPVGQWQFDLRFSCLQIFCGSMLSHSSCSPLLWLSYDPPNTTVPTVLPWHFCYPASSYPSWDAVAHLVFQMKDQAFFSPACLPSLPKFISQAHRKHYHWPKCPASPQSLCLPKKASTQTSFRSVYKHVTENLMMPNSGFWWAVQVVHKNRGLLLE